MTDGDAELAVDDPAARGGTVPHGLTVLVSDDPIDLALSLSGELAAEVVQAGEELRVAIQERLVEAGRRIDAAEALRLHDDLHRPVAPPIRVLTDTAGLRKLAVSLRRAASFVDESQDAVRRRLGSPVSELAVHPDAIRNAAGELRGARVARSAIEAELSGRLARWEAERATGGGPGPDHVGHLHDDPWPEHADDDLAGAEQFGATGDEEAQRRLHGTSRFRRRPPAATPREASAQPRGRHGEAEDGRASPSMLRVVLLVGLAVAIAAVCTAFDLVPYGGAFVLPVLTLPWALEQVREKVRDLRDRAEAADNLAQMSALTEQAYAGEVLHPDDPPEPDASGAVEPADVVLLRARLQTADQRVAQAQATWTALVGPDADPDDLDSVLRARDAQFDLSPLQVEATPTVRVAQSYERRLWARWKVAWAALDRPVPSLDEAEDAISRLEADDVHVVAVPRWHDADAVESAERWELRQRYEALADGRSREELVADAAKALPDLVVADEDRSLDPASLDQLLSGLPADFRIVVIQPPAA